MRRVLGASALIACALISTSDARAQRPPSQSHSIYMTAVEFRGSTTTDKLAPPPVDPTKLSHGYVYKRPGLADPAARDRWEVSTYQFSPSFMTVRQDDSVMLTVFIVNGDHHEVELTDPRWRADHREYGLGPRTRVHRIFPDAKGRHLPFGMRGAQAVDDGRDHGASALGMKSVDT
jgi:hypothetical protein